MSEEEYRRLPLLRFRDALRLIKRYPIDKGDHYMEVARYAHPNLHIVSRDPKNGKYYEYPISYVYYSDRDDPLPHPTWECGFTIALKLEKLRRAKTKR